MRRNPKGIPGFFGLLGALISIVFVSCGDTVVDPKSTSVSSATAVYLNKIETYMTVGATEHLYAYTDSTSATSYPVTWMSSNTAIATVSDTGLVTSVVSGTATIYATSKSDATQRSACVIHVVNSVTALTGLSVTTAAVYVDVGTQFTAVFTPSDATNQNITWASSNEDVATVNYAGYVTGVAEGTTIITAVSEYSSAITWSKEITVTSNLVDSIALASTATSITDGATCQLTALLTAVDTAASLTNSALSWTTSASSVATVSSSGLVTGVAPGTVSITATAQDGSGIYGTIDLKVVPNYVDSITMASTWSVAKDAAAFTLAYTITGVTSTLDVTDATLVWTSSNTSIATIDSSTGKITLTGTTGETTIKATAADQGTVSASCTLTVVAGDVAVTSLAAAKGINKVVLSWTDPSGVFDHLVVYDGTNSYTVASGVQTYTVSSLTKGTSYTFTVTAYDSSSNALGPSVSVTQAPFFTALTNVPALTSIPMGGVNLTGKTVASISAYALGTTEVTYGDWVTVSTWAASNGYTLSGGFQGGGYISSAYTYNSITTSDSQPVAGVTWINVAVWCNAASAMEGLTPVYYSDSALSTVLVSNTTAVSSVYMSTTANGYRLPTEAEWEAAATYKDGSNWNSGSNVSGDASAAVSSSTVLGNYCWYYTNSSVSSSRQTHNVGTSTANALGLYDMSGNLWELVWDWYVADYTSYTEADTAGPTSGTYKVYKGGQFFSQKTTYDLCPGGHYTKSNNTSVYYYIGFRLAMKGNH